MTSLSPKKILLLLFLSVAVLGIQLSRIERPFTGHFASYQATVMASISRNMLRENFSDLLNPKTDTLLLSDKRLLHLNQYPLPAVTAALGVRLFGGTFEFWGRFLSVLFNLLTILIVGMLTRRLFSNALAWIAAAVFGLSPITLIYGQSFMSEPSSLFFLLFSFFVLVPADQRNRLTPATFLSALSFSIACTGRLHFILFCPLHWFLIARSVSNGKIVRLLLFTAVAAVLPLAWYFHTYMRSLAVENIHSNLFVQMGLPASAEDSLWSFRYLQRLIGISQILLTPLLIPFFAVGIVRLPRNSLAFGFIALGLLFGGIVIVLAPQKVMRHDFYLYAFFPFVAMVTAVGIEGIIRRFPILKTNGMILLALSVYLLFSARYFAHPLFKGNPDELQAIWVAKKIQALTEPDRPVIAMGRNNPVFIYYLNRPAWNMDLGAVGTPIPAYLKNERFLKVDLRELDTLEKAMQNPFTWLEYLRGKGADYLVTSRREDLEALPDLLTYLNRTFQRLSQDEDDFYCFKLSPST